MKIVVGLIVMVLVVGILASIIFFFFPQLWLAGVFYAKYNQPQVQVVPANHQINIAKNSAADAKSYDYYGFSFSTPWGNPDQVLAGDGKLPLLMFKNNKAVGISPGIQISEVVKGQYSPTDIAKLKATFGEDALKTEYGYFTAMYELTPKDLDLLAMQQKVIGTTILLISKGAYLTGVSKIYAFNLAEIKGYELDRFGKSYQLQIFAPGDKILNLDLFGATQDEADYVLSTVYPLGG